MYRMNPYTAYRPCLRCLGKAARSSPSVRHVISRRGHANAVKPEVLGPKPMRVAIVGSGPAGFYAASRLMARVEDVYVDMYEKLPTPFGLVRYGVAPDHPEVKNCEEKFTEVAESPRFRFIGNIELGAQLPLRALKEHYDAILFSYGAPYDRTSGILNSHLEGVHSARSFVGWYNGLPEHKDLTFDLSSAEEAVVIGNGNVALDVARILLTDVDQLRKTDIAEHAIEQLQKSKVKRVRIIGRRGLMQASFTIKEVRELLRLSNVAFRPINPAQFPPSDVLGNLDRAQKRILDLLSKASSAAAPPDLSSKCLSLEFLMQPVAFEDHPMTPTNHVHRTTFQAMQHHPASAHLKSGRVSGIYYEDELEGLQRAGNLIDVLKTKDRFESKQDLSFISKQFPPDLASRGGDSGRWAQGISIPSDLVFTSIGYKSASLFNAKEDLCLPFDDSTGHFPQDGQGRIVSGAPTNDSAVQAGARPLRGLYCAGWVKTGPKGVIANTMTDAFMTAEAIAKDWATGALSVANNNSRGWEGVKAEADRLGLRATDWNDWKKIDKIERERGKEKGKLREKIVDVNEMLDLLE